MASVRHHSSTEIKPYPRERSMNDTTFTIRRAVSAASSGCAASPRGLHAGCASSLARPEGRDPRLGLWTRPKWPGPARSRRGAPGAQVLQLVGRERVDLHPQRLQLEPGDLLVDLLGHVEHAPLEPVAV